MTVPVLIKRRAENLIRDIDFSDYMRPGDTLIDVASVSVEPVGLHATALGVDGAVAQLRLTGGDHGTYRITISANTQAGEYIEGVVQVSVT